jgi:hypothetical protein
MISSLNRFSKKKANKIALRSKLAICGVMNFMAYRDVNNRLDSTNGVTPSFWSRLYRPSVYESACRREREIRVSASIEFVRYVLCFWHDFFLFPPVLCVGNMLLVRTLIAKGRNLCSDLILIKRIMWGRIIEWIIIAYLCLLNIGLVLAILDVLQFLCTVTEGVTFY